MRNSFAEFLFILLAFFVTCACTLMNMEYGTVCQPSCESRTSHSDSFDEHSKRIYLVLLQRVVTVFFVRCV